MEDYLFYIIFVLLVTLIGINHKYLGQGKTNLFLWIIIFFVTAFRYNVGYDYLIYYELIENKKFEYFELIPRYFGYIANYYKTPEIFFLLSSLWICFFFYKGIKNNSLNPIVSTLAFLFIPLFYLQSLSIIRQWMAIAVVFYGYSFIRERNLKKFIICAVTAVMCHFSAIIVAPLYFLVSIRFNILIYIIIYISSFFISDFMKYIVQSTSWYQNLLFGDHLGGDKLIIIMNLFFFTTLFLYKRINTFYLNIMLLGVFLYNTLGIFGQSGMRISMYFLIFYILIIPIIIKQFKELFLINNLYYWCGIVMFFLTLYIDSLNSTQYTPYSTIFFKN